MVELVVADLSFAESKDRCTTAERLTELAEPVTELAEHWNQLSLAMIEPKILG